MIVIIT